jgi:hypothetical protein
MQLRGKLLAAAVPTALVMTGLAQAPALAATNHFATLYESPRHIKAQACQLPYKNSQGQYIRAVRWRADARSATLGGSVQFHNTGGRGAYTSGWVGFKKRSVSKVTSTYFLQNEAATVYLRIKTSHGTSKWSKARAITSLPVC